MPIRPEAERKLRAGFQRRVDEQSERYAAPLGKTMPAFPTIDEIIATYARTPAPGA